MVDTSGILVAQHRGRTTLTVSMGRSVDTSTVYVVSEDAPISKLSSVTGGLSHSCGLTPAGEVKCWGTSWHDELGLGSSRRLTATLTPVAVPTSMLFDSVDAGAMHTCALARSGEAYCWGDNMYGQLGTGDLKSGSKPIAVRTDVRFTQISAGMSLTCAITLDGAIYCWGRMSDRNVLLPVRVAPSARFESVAAGGTHACGLTVDGSILCWGANEYGQLGAGFAGASEAQPQLVLGPSVYDAVTAGYSHTCAIARGGEAQCWGNGFDGRLGNGGGAHSASPVHVLNRGDFRTISAGGTHTCGTTGDGSAYCWGSNWRGQLGNGLDFGNQSLTASDYLATVPQKVEAGAARLVSISASAGSHTCAMTLDQVTLCWGLNTSGELGIGTHRKFKGTEFAVATIPQPVIAVP